VKLVNLSKIQYSQPKTTYLLSLVLNLGDVSGILGSSSRAGYPRKFCSPNGEIKWKRTSTIEIK